MVLLEHVTVLRLNFVIFSPDTRLSLSSPLFLLIKVIFHSMWATKPLNSTCHQINTLTVKLCRLIERLWESWRRNSISRRHVLGPVGHSIVVLIVVRREALLLHLRWCHLRNRILLHHLRLLLLLCGIILSLIPIQFLLKTCHHCIINRPPGPHINIKRFDRNPSSLT